MRKQFAALGIVSMLVFSMTTGAYSEVFSKPTEIMKSVQKNEEAPKEDSDTKNTEKESNYEHVPNDEDNIVTTKHSAVIQGKKLNYTAQTGTMFLETGEDSCEIFFTSYILDDVKDSSSRPITFAFNGGPGACSMYLNIGCLGPRRVDIDKKGYPKSMPTRMKDNENSLLDMTDIVIIDAVGSGYSRPVGESDIEAFIGYENDRRTIGDFIRQYVDRYNRWGSEKYLAGESYGTTRAVGVCDYLSDTYAMHLNGLMLISSINDFTAMYFADGNDIPYTALIPTYAADAWYHGVLRKEYLDMKLEDYLEEVRVFVEEQYVPALYKGNRISDSKKEALAETLADYIGLSKDFVLKSNLHVSLDDFSKELLKDKKLMIGRYDGRITGPVIAGNLENGSNDPSNSAFSLSFGSAFNDYLLNELGFQTDRPYIPMDGDINYLWTFPIDVWGGYMYQENIIHDLMSKNNFLKIWVLCGYYDAATPFYGAEWTFNHVFLDDPVKDNLTFTYYESGHMLYIEKESFDKFRKDAETWYGKK